jgi:hypothetical protein
MTNGASATIRGSFERTGSQGRCRSERASWRATVSIAGDLPIKIGYKMWELEVSGGPTIRVHEECE